MVILFVHQFLRKFHSSEKICIDFRGLGFVLCNWWCPGDPAVPGYSTKASEALRVFNDLADAGGLSRALVVLLLVLLSSIAYGGRQEAMGGYISLYRHGQKFWEVLECQVVVLGRFRGRNLRYTEIWIKFKKKVSFFRAWRTSTDLTHEEITFHLHHSSPACILRERRT